MESDAPLRKQRVSLACPLTADLRQTDLAMIKRGRELRRLINQVRRTLPGPSRSLIYAMELASLDGQSWTDLLLTHEGQI